MSEVAETIEMATLDKEMAEEKVKAEPSLPKNPVAVQGKLDQTGCPILAKTS